ncbi:hypothetical protein PpBr36_04732 [Pyricularia pennisetigena]|uniref:hypothetical protein n=1 Tax=Pyricularia pennisetigena TaxID=1578925 RepID=UPI0011534C1D|nr:hypothetical protein PpBr36_04732 [Pyricularia pennisetigena]TLS27022.1 hypothetical protein PpBr36_04732 [Pyricularia pennisetigena]
MTSTVEKTPTEVTSAAVTASPGQAVHPEIAAAAQPVEAVTEKPQPTVASQAAPNDAAPAATSTEQTPSSAASPETQPVATGGATVQDTEQTASFPQRLKDEDRHWAWKVAFRALQCIVCLVGIGCCAWIIAATIRLKGDSYFGVNFSTDQYMANIAISLFVFSILWGIIDLLVRLCRKPPRPIHPAVTLSIDLCFWLTFIIPILASVIAYAEIDYLGSQLVIRDPTSDSRNSYRGEYRLNQTTDTWIYNITYIERADREYNYTSRTWYYPKTDPSTIIRDCSSYYSSCAEQDEMVNALWKQKPTRIAVLFTVIAMLALVTLCHFQLFVWACVDTHKWRMNKKQAELTKSIEGMLATGQLVLSPVPGNGQLVLRPSAAYLPTQVYLPAQAFPPAMQQAPPATAQQWQGHMVPPPQKHDASTNAAFFADAILPIHLVKNCPLSEWISCVSTGLIWSTASLDGSGDNSDGSCMVSPGLLLVPDRLCPGQVVGADRIVWAKRANNIWKMRSFIVDNTSHKTTVYTLKSLQVIEPSSLAEV